MLALTVLKSPVLDPLTGTTYRVSSVEPILIGRSKSAQIRLIHEHVSRRHAEFIPFNEAWCLRNHSGKNPTFVNGQAIESDVKLNLHDKIRIANFLFEITALSWVKQTVEVTEPIIADGLADGEIPIDEEDEGALTTEFESLLD